MVIFVLSPDKENEKKLQGAHTSLLDKHFLYLFKVPIFSPESIFVKFITNTAKVK